MLLKLLYLLLSCSLSYTWLKGEPQISRGEILFLGTYSMEYLYVYIYIYIYIYIYHHYIYIELLELLDRYFACKILLDRLYIPRNIFKIEEKLIQEHLSAAASEDCNCLFFRERLTMSARHFIC